MHKKAIRRLATNMVQVKNLLSRERDNTRCGPRRTISTMENLFSHRSQNNPHHKRKCYPTHYRFLLPRNKPWEHFDVLLLFRQ